MNIEKLFEQNKIWAEQIEHEHPGFFEELSKQQNPKFLWIGCSDSRVPANQIVNLKPGEVFVHRNIANQVLSNDFNCMSVVQFAIEVLEVEDIIVCGHYGCGGVNAALTRNAHGLVDYWIWNIRNIKNKYSDFFNSLNKSETADKLCELNVIEQVHNLANTKPLKEAWNNKKNINIHGFIYGLNNGLLKNLNTTVSSEKDTEKIYQESLGKLI
ncbi:MAG: carbonate dehydratase [Melioribacteraceae bacterium]|nr:carbonate dehydratase [Melioribacteraceae bacterium]MDD3558379.1 carbonate dehydratase [Melioribacteraceae bacterium]